jgi:DNA-binding NtrC family response regulator
VKAAKPPVANSGIERILVVDDDLGTLSLLKTRFSIDGFCVETAEDVAVALRTATIFQPTVVLTDLVMPGLDGLDLLKGLRRIAPTLPIVVLTGAAEPTAAQECYKRGACWYLTKPMSLDALVRLVRAAAHGLTVPRGQAQLKQFIRWLVQESKALGQLQAQISRAARSADAVLLMGNWQATRAAARLIHALSPRHLEDFLTVECQADTARTVEQIFGKEGPAGQKEEGDRVLLSALDLARGGTLHVDAIEKLPPDAQARLRAAVAKPSRRRVRLLLSTENIDDPPAHKNPPVERIRKNMYDQSILLPMMGGKDWGALCIIECVANQSLFLARLGACGRHTAEEK